MNRRTLFTVLLALVLCFSIALATGAAQLTPKDLVVDKIKNLNLGIDKGFYEKSQGESHFEITKFTGSITEEWGDYASTAIDFLTQLDASNNTIRINYTTNIKGNTHNGDIYLQDDQVILTKDLFYLLQEFGLDVLKNDTALLEQNPQYLYFSHEPLKGVWEQMTSYQNQQLPEEYKEILLFMVEAVPDKYFSLSPGKITFKLDQAGFEDVIYNLLTKIKNEEERFADILVGLNKYNFEQLEITPEEMKQEIISGIEELPIPPRETIHLASNFMEVADFTYESSLLPGGPHKFNLNINFKAPDGSAKGNFTVTVDTAGKQDNLKGSYLISGNFSDSEGLRFDFELISNFGYTGSVGKSDLLLNVTSKNHATGELMFDFSASGNSVTKVDSHLTLKAPKLTANNSIDITSLIAKPEEFNLVVNGDYIETDVRPYINDNNQTMVPVRAVYEALGCKVKWVAPNEIHITGKDKEILMFVNENTYTVNGVEKTMDIPAYLEADKRTIVPVSFIVDELGAEVKLIGKNIVITK